jgi:FPC/CPF motif-containing protein YcgG
VSLICLNQIDAFNENHPIRIQYPWIKDSLRDLTLILSNIVDENVFPCVFAQHAFAKNQLHYLFAGSPFNRVERKQVRKGLLEYLDHMDGLTGIEESMQALLIIFEPDSSPLSADAYHQRAWMIMQDWLDHDPSPWPKQIPSDPHAPFWSLCFRGIPLFINVSSPGHKNRRSRNLGKSLVLVAQPRAGFDHVADGTAKGDKIRKLIRMQMEKYEGMPFPKELGTYHRGDLEWWQYILQERNAPRTDRCPLRKIKLNND